VIIGRNLKNKLFLRLKREDGPRGHTRWKRKYLSENGSYLLRIDYAQWKR
jgi:hypothetical protein